jgi:hypothetical protein
MYSTFAMKRKVLLKGQAGLDLLHRISSINMPALATGFPRTGLLLNPAGRIQSCFEITRTGADSAEIAFEDSFLERLEHYTFAERYEISELPCSTGTERSLRERILNLIPEAGREFLPDGETNPLEVNLGSAIDSNKGCYPGQEVIEKILALGSPARRLCLLKRMESVAEPSEKGPMECIVPAILHDATGAEAGKLTSSDGEYALAILKRTHLKPGLELRGPDHGWRVEKVSS